MAQNWSTILDTDKAGAWGVPAGKVSALDTAMVAAQSAYAATEGAGRGPVASEHCKEAFVALQAAMRYIKDRYFFMPPLTAEDFVSLGLKVPDTTPTPVDIANKQVDFELEPKGVYLVEIRCWDHETGEKRILEGLTGIDVRYAFTPEPVTDLALLTENIVLTKTRHTFHVDPANRGKWLSAACCWYAAGPKYGQWVAVQSAIVP
jgi:hypothetical protein